MTAPLNVAVAGLGTVGAGVLKLLRDHADLVAARAGRPIVVTAVSARDRRRDRGVDLSAMRWFDDATALAAEADCDAGPAGQSFAPRPCRRPPGKRARSLRDVLCRGR